MGYVVKQVYESGFESTGGYSYGFLAVDGEDDFALMSTWQDGSVAYIEGDPDALYIKIAGVWTQQVRTPVGPGPHIELDGVNPFTLIAANHLFARRAEVAPELEADKYQYYIRDALPTTEDDNFEGMIVYVKADGETETPASLSVCTTPGVQELDTVTVTKGAITQAGDITVTLNNEVVTVELVKNDTPSTVAAKIKVAVDAAVTATEGGIAAWTVTAVGAVLTFKKDATGECLEPAADAGATGVTFSDPFDRINEGVDAVWGTLINAAGT